MNHHETFNDPFECRCEIKSGFPKRGECPARLKEIARAWGFEDENDASVLEYYDEYIFSLENTEPNVPYIIDNARISCFSKNPDNLLMWSHYADGLRGFCVEFDPELILSKHTENAFIFEVLYDENPASIDTAVMAVLNDQIDFHEDAIVSCQQEMKHLNKDKQEEISMYEQHLKDVFRFNKEIYQKMLATKPVNWKYENELRVICQAKDPAQRGEYLSYPPEAVKSIIIGEKIPTKKRNTLVGIIKKHASPVLLKEAVRIAGSFKIEIKNIKSV